MTDTPQLQWDAQRVLDYLRDHRETLRGFGVRKIGLFGSYAHGDYTPESDMDFLVEMEGSSYRNFMNLWHFLEDSFGVEVDLGEPHTLREEIRDDVLRNVRYVQEL